MTSKVEARRFSGKPGTWAHYAMSVNAHLAVEDLDEYLNDGTSFSGDKLALWRKAQQKIFAYLILTCDDRAATTLQSVDATKDDRGLAAFKALQDKHDAKVREMAAHDGRKIAELRSKLSRAEVALKGKTAQASQLERELAQQRSQSAVAEARLREELSEATAALHGENASVQQMADAHAASLTTANDRADAAELEG